MPESLFEKLKKQVESEKQEIVVQDGDGSVLEKLKEIGDQKQVNPPVPETPVDEMIAQAAEENERPEEPKPAVEKTMTPCPDCGKEFQHLSRHRCNNKKVDFVETPIIPHPEVELINNQEESSRTHSDYLQQWQESVERPLQEALELIQNPPTEAIPLSEDVGLSDKDGIEPQESCWYDLVLDALFEKNEDGTVFLFSDIIAPLLDEIAKEHGAYWSTIEYGKGPGFLANKLEKSMQASPWSGIILVDSSTAEANACKGVLKKHARNIIQGVR